MAISIPSDNLSGGGVGWTSTGMTVPAWTSYVVTVNGRTTATRNPAATACSQFVTFPSEGSYGPSGTANYELTVSAAWSSGGGWPSNIQLNFSGYGASGSSTATSDTLFNWGPGEIVVARSGIAGVVGGGSPHCEAGLYLLSSDQTISLTTFDGQELSVTPSAVAVHRGTVVTFTATSRGSVVSTPNWRFDPDSGEVNQTSTCGTYTAPNPCAVTINNNGHLRASKDLQGRMRAANARIRVYTTFTLDADKASIMAGDTVRFTPKLDGTAGPAARWLWRGDSSTITNPCISIVNNVCEYVPDRSGKMWAYVATTGGDSASAAVELAPPSLDLTASSTVVGEGDSVTFVGSLTPSTAAYQVIGWSWIPDSGSVMASRAPLSSGGVRMTPDRVRAPQPRRSTADSTTPPVDSLAPPDSIWSTEGAPADVVPAVPATQPCAGAQLSCTTAIFQSGKMQLTIVSNGDTVRAAKNVYVHYQCRPIIYTSLRIGPFPAWNIGGAFFPDSAVLEAPLEFTGNYYGQENGIPTGWYRPVSGYETRLGYKLVSGEVVLLCRTSLMQRSDGSTYWRGSEIPIYAGHHNLHFGPVAP